MLILKNHNLCSATPKKPSEEYFSRLAKDVNIALMSYSSPFCVHVSRWGNSVEEAEQRGQAT